MAYDPNDADTKAAVQAAIDEALEAQAETHAAEIAGLKRNNERLKGDLKKAKAGEPGEDNTAEIERLEAELRENKANLAKSQKEQRDAARDRDKYKGELETETRQADALAIETQLTGEMDRVNVAPQFRSATKALLREQVKVGRDADGKRVVTAADGKPLGEFVTSWSQGDDGKHYIAAPANSGGGGGSPPQGGGGAPSNKSYRNMTTNERLALSKSDPAKFDAAHKDWISNGKPLPEKAA